MAQKVVQLLGEGSHEQLWSSVFQYSLPNQPTLSPRPRFVGGRRGTHQQPVGGQGINGGIQDAHNLAWKLARVLAGADVESLLTSYETERGETVLASVDRYTDMLTDESARFRYLREARAAARVRKG